MNFRHYLRPIAYFIGGLIVTGGLLGAPLSEAATYYVAKTGNNANSCSDAQNATTPKLTINAGLGCLSGESTLIIKKGVYAERIPLYSIPSGSEDRPTTIKAEQRGTVTLRPTSGHIVDIYERSHITLDGLVLDGSGLPATEYEGLKATGSNTHHITIRYVEVKNLPDGTGFSIGGAYQVLSHVKATNIKTIFQTPDDVKNVGIYFKANHSLIENSEVNGTVGASIQLYWSGHSDQVEHNTLRNNIFRNSEASGNLVLYGSRNYIYNNVFYGSKVGVKIHGDKNILRNNIAYPGTESPAFTNKGTDNTFSNNFSTVSGPGIQYVGNPQFVSPSTGDFRLQTSSPAVDKGMTLSEVPTDRDGVPKPQGAAYDIGVYEYRETLPVPLPVPTRLRTVSAQ